MNRRSFFGKLAAAAAIGMARSYLPLRGVPDPESIWQASWSPETVYSIYPKGSTAGLQQLSQVRIEAASTPTRELTPSEDDG